MKEIFFKAGKRLTLFLVILFASDRVIGYYLERLYLKSKNGEFYQTTYAVKEAKEDVLIFGSSRAMHHYNSNIIEKHVQLPTYNLGRSGENILYSYAVFSQVLSNYKPKLVILDVQPSEFSWKAGKEGEDAMIAALLPFKDFPVINKSISEIRQSEVFLSNLFKTYPYNSNVAQILGYYYGFMSDEESNNGYVALKGNKISEKTQRHAKGKNRGNDPELIRIFKQFIALAKANNVQLCVMVSPTTDKMNTNSIPLIRKLTEEAAIPFFDCSTLPDFNDYKLFYDETHLNEEGAALFTNQVVNKLNELNLSSEQFAPTNRL